MTTPLDETKNPTTQTPLERGPNYDWKHEAEHYRAECDNLRRLLESAHRQGSLNADNLIRAEDLVEHYQETLELIAAGSEFQCAAGERNCIAAARACLAQQAGDKND